MSLARGLPPIPVNFELGERGVYIFVRRGLTTSCLGATGVDTFCPGTVWATCVWRLFAVTVLACLRAIQRALVHAYACSKTHSLGRPQHQFDSCMEAAWWILFGKFKRAFSAMHLRGPRATRPRQGGETARRAIGEGPRGGMEKCPGGAPGGVAATKSCVWQNCGGDFVMHP